MAEVHKYSTLNALKNPREKATLNTKDGDIDVVSYYLFLNYPLPGLIEASILQTSMNEMTLFHC
ncbi:MAG: hypothetical protein GF411_10165 [Candidatus Lokiarchaeota archaeon]|nr:hypothetical protein [Candidatus Lokiarchaeota archaeon]